VRAVPPWLP